MFKNIEKILKKYQKSIDNVKIMCYNKVYPTKKGGKIMKILKSILDWVVFILTGKGDIADEMVRDGVISYEGQGRDRFGR